MNTWLSRRYDAYRIFWFSMMLARGFTLIELMITIAIAAILLAVGVPSFADFITNTRISTDSSNLIADLAFARSEAVKRGLPVTVCKKTSGASTCSTGSWSTGRLIFVDLATAGTVGTLDGTDTLLRVREDLATGNVLASSGFINAHYIQYLSNASTDSAGSFQLTRSGFTGRNLCVNAAGRVRTQTTACP